MIRRRFDLYEESVLRGNLRATYKCSNMNLLVVIESLDGTLR